jgi:hypothetical protein
MCPVGRLSTIRFIKQISVTACVLAFALVLVGCGTPASSLASPSAVATVSSTPSASPAPTGAITGALGFPSDFIPPSTVYAVNVADRRIFFSVDTPRYPLPMSVTMTPPSYTITGIVPGTYNVFAYRNDDRTYDRGGPGLHSRFFLTCAPPPAPSSCNDHTLLPVLVTSGQTVANVDVKDWIYDALKTTFPPRP